MTKTKLLQKILMLNKDRKAINVYPLPLYTLKKKKSNKNIEKKSMANDVHNYRSEENRQFVKTQKQLNIYLS